MTLTPMDIEKKLVFLSQQIEKVQTELNDKESEYVTAKMEYELAMAHSRKRMMGARTEAGTKLTAQERDDLALLENEDAYRLVNALEVLVKALRGTAGQIKTQVDIARSLGTSVRTAME